MNRNVDAIIIGAGVIGAATAFELAKKGFKTLSVDREPAAGYGSTSASCAVIRFHYSTRVGTAFAFEGYHYWRNWADYLQTGDERGLATFLETGCLVMRTPQNAFMADHLKYCRDLNVPFEFWSEAEIKARLPIYDLTSYWPAKRLTDQGFGVPGEGRVDGGVFFPSAGYVTDPQLSTHNLQRATEAQGGKFLFGRAVVDVLRRAERVSGVRLDDGRELHAPIVVNVAGPASAKVNALADVLSDMTISTRALRQEVAHLPSPGGFNFEHDGIIVSDSDIACYCRPESGNHILVGSEDPECDPHEWVDDEEYDRDFTDQWTHQAHRYAQRVPSLGIPSRMRGVVGLYDVTDDWIPIYDRSSLDGYYMAVGSSGNQFKNAPIAGKMMAQLITYVEAGNDHDAQPLIFNLPHINQNIDLGFYSRKRDINRESSFSVVG